MKKNILLDDILKIGQKGNVKVRFTVRDGERDAINIYETDKEKVNTEMLFNKTRKELFKVGETVIHLIKISDDIWLLGTIKIITNNLKVNHGINYEGREVSQYKKFFDKIIIKYHKQQSVVYKYKTIKDDLEVFELSNTKYAGRDFLGYDKVINIPFIEMKEIIKSKNTAWCNALKYQKGIYLLKDHNTGKMYVGAAYNKNMLLGRWTEYINTGDGGNKKLKKLGYNYIEKNFSFSIIENYNSNISDDFILQREQYWIDMLLTRKHGYN